MRYQVSQLNRDLSILPAGQLGLIKYRPDSESDNRGLGLAPLILAAPAAGPAAPIVVGAAFLGSALSKIFGFGGDDQITNYKPPANAAQLPVTVGGVNIAFDMNDLRQAMARGNRAEDLYSYYSAFVSNSVEAGASKAAKKVILDTAARYGTSIAYAAASILTTAGVRRIDYPNQPAPQQQFLPSGQGPQQQPAPSTLDNIADTVSKILGNIFKQKPVSQPAPMPAPAPAPAQTPPIASTGGASQAVLDQLYQQALQAALTIGSQLAQQLLARKTAIANQAAAAGCDPAAQYYDPTTNRCVFLLPCPVDQYFEPQLGTCMSLGEGEEEDFFDFLNSFGNIGGIPIWLLLLAGLLLITSVGGSDSGTVSFRARRRRR